MNNKGACPGMCSVTRALCNQGKSKCVPQSWLRGHLGPAAQAKGPFCQDWTTVEGALLALVAGALLALVHSLHLLQAHCLHLLQAHHVMICALAALAADTRGHQRVCCRAGRLAAPGRGPEGHSCHCIGSSQVCVCDCVRARAWMRVSLHAQAAGQAGGRVDCYKLRPLGCFEHCLGRSRDKGNGGTKFVRPIQQHSQTGTKGMEGP
eukprot:1139525-Pelagomonas_calceolata.AAC.1